MLSLFSAERPLKSKSRWQKGILLLILALFMVAATGCFGLVPKAPHEEMIAALKKSNKLKELSLTADISFQIQSDDHRLAMFNEIFSKMSVALRLNVDKKEKRGQLDYSILYKGVNCGNLLLYADQEKISTQSIFLGDQTFLFAWNDLQPVIKKYFGLQVQISDYFPLLFETKRRTQRQVEKAIYDLYTDFYADHLTASTEMVAVTITDGQQETTIPCKELLLQMDHEDFNMEESYRYLRAFLEHEAMIGLFKEKITQLLTIAKNNGDLATWPVTEEEMIAFRDNLDFFLTELTTRMISQQQSMQAALPSQPQMNIEGKFRIDRRGLWRNMVMREVLQFNNPETEEPLLVEVFFEANLGNPGQELAFLDFTTTDVLDVAKLSAPDWQRLGEEVSMNFMTQLMVNPLIQDIVQLSTFLGSEEQ